MPSLKSFILFFLVVGIIILRFIYPPKSNIPLIAIANYGPHSSLHESIRGLKDGLAKKGYIEGKNIRYEIADINFDTSLIMQMLSNLKAQKPKAIVTISTPITQAAKNMIKDIPIIFMDITDPVEAGILDFKYEASGNVTGAADTQNLELVLQFAKSMSPNIKRIGMLYSTGEANDIALLKNMENAAAEHELQLFSVPVESARDVNVRMYQFKDKVDLIYVGSSGAVQPSLPAIVAYAEQNNIPVLNMNGEEVIDGNVLASFGVSFFKVGNNAAKLVHKLLDYGKVENLKPIYPSKEDHEAFISKKRLEKIDFKLSDSLPKTVHMVD